METSHQKILGLIYGDERSRRFTQDSPVLPEVWIEYFKKIPNRADLLLNPNRRSSVGDLHNRLGQALAAQRAAVWKTRRGRIHSSPKPTVYHESHVAAELWFDELVRAALPLTRWWWKYVWKRKPRTGVIEPSRELVRKLAEALEEGGGEFTSDLLWLVKVLGWYEWKSRSGAGDSREPTCFDLARLALELLDGLSLREPPEPFPLWSVSLNRDASLALWQSVPAIKADAANRVFSLSCRGLRWAVVDSGIDASHPAFVDRARIPAEAPEPRRFRDQDSAMLWRLGRSRVVKTYDFTRLRSLLDPDDQAAEVGGDVYDSECRRRMKEMKRSLRSGRAIDWGALEPKLAVNYDGKYQGYRLGIAEHGTHVAGIIGADWQKTDRSWPPGEDHELRGTCPDIEIYDLRVFDGEGRSSEFLVMAALQFVRWLNASKDQPVIHGVNLSLSIQHDVRSFACGRTPVCEECERLTGSGVVVVAAAGNQGHSTALQSLGGAQYQDISITDPGNAESIITVGATHRYMPHTYGVSYFSSRGPTGDGRAKPDLVAPGEKIKSTTPGAGVKSLDGTSMAAPHVSGAAALLMARHPEFIGQPLRIKQILVKTATDLGRERYFQGAGMIDILRALQSV